MFKITSDCILDLADFLINENSQEKLMPGLYTLAYQSVMDDTQMNKEDEELFVILVANRLLRKTLRNLK